MTLSYAILAFVIGIVVACALYPVINHKKIKQATQTALQIKAEADKDIDVLKQKADLEIKELRINVRKDLERKFEKETRDKKTELSRLETRIIQREEKLDKRTEEQEKLGVTLKERDNKIKEREQQTEEVLAAWKNRLEKIANLSAEQAKDILLKEVEKDLELEIAVRIRKGEEEIKDTADKKAKDIVSIAIQKVAVDHANDTTVSVVPLPNDEMKGRIIGREGRNIRTLESLLGVNIIIDDTPEAVVISGFNNIRREIARIVLERLVADGRIHPARIEEMVQKVEKEIEEKIKEKGNEAAESMGVKVSAEIVKALGRLHYRTSYGQNVLAHSLEVATLAAAMAAELKCDVTLAKRAGLLHDIGKAIDHEIEGTHTQLGAEMAKRNGEKEPVINAILAHHEEEKPQTIEAVLVATADAISAARYGARHESIEAYIKRLQELENVASSFPGVDKTYAIQAGRELRVIVKPEEIDDNLTYKLARDISKKVEESLEYPGEIKVVVVREIRSTEYAR
ncbi:MAG: ribonuclease Y [Candidatus Wallbacteria bacterium]|nr:ribonuclease Y [Candidatus Wallbacteria bacterium]